MLEFEVEAAPELCGDLATRVMARWPELEVRTEENRVSFCFAVREDLDRHLKEFEQSLQAVEKSRGLSEELVVHSRNLRFGDMALDRVTVGRFEIRRPGGESQEDPDLISLTVDPGDAFGTGAHPSTMLALQAMEQYLAPIPGLPVREGLRVLDLGTGSGILALAALGMGAAFVQAVDASETALETARKNAEYNGAQGRIEFIKGRAERLKGRRFDLVLANLVPSVLVRAGRRLPDLVEPDGAVIISGFPDTQVPQVVKSMTKAGLNGWKTYSRGGWSAITLMPAPREEYCSLEEFRGNLDAQMEEKIRQELHVDLDDPDMDLEEPEASGGGE